MRFDSSNVGGDCVHNIDLRQCIMTVAFRIFKLDIFKDSQTYVISLLLDFHENDFRQTLSKNEL